MKAINSNIVCKDRNKLQDVIPLKMPYSLAVDPSNVCNFKCNFCAIQSKKCELPFKKQLMKKELFYKIVDDIARFPEKLKVLRINGQGEPLLNPDLPQMIHYAKQKRIADFIEIITNGSCLNPELNQRLIDSGIDRIRISIEALDSAGYAEIANVKLDYDKFLANIRDLHERSGKCEIYCKIVDAAVPTKAEQEKFFDMYEDICDRFFVDNVIPLWSEFDEVKDYMNTDQKGMHGQKLKNVAVCPFSFYSLIVNSDGEVTVCCADWKRKLVVGNIEKSSFMEIWNGDTLRHFWIDMLRGKKNQYEMCAKCVLPMYDCNDDIDEYAEQILERIQNS